MKIFSKHEFILFSKSEKTKIQKNDSLLLTCTQQIYLTLLNIVSTDLRMLSMLKRLEQKPKFYKGLRTHVQYFGLKSNLHKRECIPNWSTFVLLTKLIFLSEDDRSSKHISFFLIEIFHFN